jgi:predicted Zn-dependent protease with MMP-like domain
VPRPWNRRATEDAPKPPPWKDGDNLDEYGQLRAARLEHLVDVREPLVLVSQIQRSAGTLLSQLLDGHPECHAHSQELQIGHPNIRDWPDLDLGRPDRWFPALYEPKAGERLRDGYSKAPKGEAQVFPFCFVPSLQQAIFERCVASRPVERARDVLDCYFTSYFNAWLDNHNLYTGPKKVVTAFAPGMATSRANVEAFFSAYPDGVLVSVVRDAGGWYGSARKYKPRLYDAVEQAVPAWRESTEAALDAAGRYGERVVLLTYEQLVVETQETMRQVAERIGISMAPVLLVPTFNGRPIRANSSDAVERDGILPERMTAYRDALDDATLRRIEELAGNLYDRVVVAATR